MAAFDLFVSKFETKYPKAFAGRAKDRDELLSSYDFHAEHWKHLTCRTLEAPKHDEPNRVDHRDGGLRTTRTKSAGSRAAGLAMVFKLARAAERKWRGLERHTLLGDIIRGRGALRRRRGARPVLPVRELHAQAPATMRALLEARGYTHRASAGYRLIFPFPELAHHSERRLEGLLSPPPPARQPPPAGRLPQACFDSWVMRFDKAR